MERILKLALKCGRTVQVSDRTMNYRAIAKLGASILGAPGPKEHE